MKKLIPNKLKVGDTIGVIAPSDPITVEDVDELKQAIKIAKKDGFKVKLSKNIYSNTNIYSASAKEKAEDINKMFKDENIKMIWCACGGENSNTTFDYIDYEIIKQNPKIICGYSDITSITNVINSQTGLITFSSTNFKSIGADETDYSYKEVIKRFVDGNLELGIKKDIYVTLKEGKAKGELIGGNLSLINGIVDGKYKLKFKDKILFLEELGYETSPALASNYLYRLKQNGVFKQIQGLWIGNYAHESGIELEKIVIDTIGNEYNFPIIKSNNFGHIDTKTVIPIGTNALIDTTKDKKIELIEKCVK